MFNIQKVCDDIRHYLTKEIHSSSLEEHKLRYTKSKWFSKDHYVLMGEKFILNLGHGPQRFDVTFDLSMAATFYYLANNQNVEKTIQEMKDLMNKHNQEWTAKVGAFMKEAM